MPIFKSGCKLLVNNYLPISLLPSLSKILEKLIKSRLLKLFGEQDVIYDYQFGFRNNHSVVYALLDVTSLCYDSIQTQKFTTLLLMDFQKAFDTASHKILLKKLYHYGVRGLAYTLMKSYLSERNQYVSLIVFNMNIAWSLHIYVLNSDGPIGGGNGGPGGPGPSPFFQVDPEGALIYGGSNYSYSIASA